MQEWGPFSNLTMVLDCRLVITLPLNRFLKLLRFLCLLILSTQRPNDKDRSCRRYEEDL